MKIIFIFALITLGFNGCKKKSVPPSRIFLKPANFSIIPPQGWIEFQRGIPAIEKERKKFGEKLYILETQQNQRYQDTYGFTLMKITPTQKDLANKIKTQKGKYIFYDKVKYNQAKSDFYSFSRTINYENFWFHIGYNTYIYKLKQSSNLIDCGLPKEIVDSIRSFKILANDTMQEEQIKK